MAYRPPIYQRYQALKDASMPAVFLAGTQHDNIAVILSEAEESSLPVLGSGRGFDKLSMTVSVSGFGRPFGKLRVTLFWQKNESAK